MNQLLDTCDNVVERSNRYKFLKPALEILECREHGEPLDEIKIKYSEFAKIYPRIFTFICTKETTRMEVINLVTYIKN